MFRKAFSFGGLLLLVGATTLMTPGLGQAQHGGGHGGGGHSGGFHSGGGFHGGFHGVGGGFHHDGFHRGGFGYYPYYGGYSYDPYVYGGGGVTDDSGYYGSYGDVAPDYSYGSPSVGDSSYYAPASDTSAHITVKVPAGARVSFGGTPTTSTGTLREYQSPPLTPGLRYIYEVQARWDDNGREKVQTREIEVRAGAHIDVSFSGPSGAAGQAR